MNTIDTITALCTVPGGAISIIRISGDRALDIGNQVWKGSRMLSEADVRVLLYGHCFPGNDKTGDPALAVYMQGPHTYTGENVVELHCHGGSVISRQMLETIVAAGARLAEPGEFTYRAFMNGKLDLTQAEAVGDIITANSDMALSLAEKQMAGTLGRSIRKLRLSLLDVLSEIEARLDFVEETLDWKEPVLLIKDLNSVVLQMRELLTSRTEGAVLRGGVRIVIAGRPNVGKSSLLNLLLGYDRAIVTEIPGTTRDTLEECATIRGIPVKMIDTAGIREADNFIEGIGIERSFASLAEAQIIVWMMDVSGDCEQEYSTMLEHVGTKRNIIAVWNKLDLCQSSDTLPGMNDNNTEILVLALSVSNTEGIEEFMDTVEKCVWHGEVHGELEIAVSSRHASLLEDAVTQLDGVDDNILQENWELASVGIRGAVSALGTITGEDVDPDILDDIFSRFCIGK